MVRGAGGFLTTSDALRHWIQYYVNRGKRLFFVFYQKIVGHWIQRGPMWDGDGREGARTYKLAFVKVYFLIPLPDCLSYVLCGYWGCINRAKNNRDTLWFNPRRTSLFVMRPSHLG